MNSQHFFSCWERYIEFLNKFIQARNSSLYEAPCSISNLINSVGQSSPRTTNKDSFPSWGSESLCGLLLKWSSPPRPSSSPNQISTKTNNASFSTCQVGDLKVCGITLDLLHQEFPMINQENYSYLSFW